ncbi:hypothetical protein WICPIJ_002827 [Wickerhamomyces pijperi]|uniref:Glutaredoxin domain-containing protein n=1 Tax=Wickerhamomyces pijperi TaxID=599730 RepID=A0A9P8TNK2_WICPI|nr:hypothetical protein WICPIJ_002827 [Wickerhamomyces pijperi]
MATSRRSRILVLAAALLLLVFIVVSSHSNNDVTAAKSRLVKDVEQNHVPKAGTPKESVQENAGLSDTIREKSSTSDSKSDQVKVDHDVSAPSRSKNEITLSPSNNKPKPSIDVVFDPSKELQSIISMSPVVIFSKTYCGYSKALKNLLASEYEITPAPTIVELDKHVNGKELQDYIGQVSGRKTVPNLFVNGVSRGGSDDMRALHSTDSLLDSLKTWVGKGATINKINPPSNS